MLKRVTSRKGPSQSHFAETTQFFSKKCREVASSWQHYIRPERKPKATERRNKQKNDKTERRIKALPLHQMAHKFRSNFIFLKLPKPVLLTKIEGMKVCVTPHVSIFHLASILLKLQKTNEEKVIENR